MTGTRRKARRITAKELRVHFREPFEVHRRVRVIHPRLLLRIILIVGSVVNRYLSSTCFRLFSSINSPESSNLPFR
jgi:hypothetical protein